MDLVDELEMDMSDTRGDDKPNYFAQSVRDLADEKWLNYRKALFVSVCFLVLFTAFDSVRSITPENLDQNGFGSLGFWELALLYLVMAFSSLISPAVVSKMGFRWCFVIGALGHFAFLLSQILPAWAAESDQADEQNAVIKFLRSHHFIKIFSFICVTINGFAAAVLWVAQGKYFSKCATPDSRGFYFGLFWSFYSGS